MSHTKGPWYVDPMKFHSNGNLRIMAEQCTPVAVVPEHMQANARLIAAAPEMMEELKRAQIMLLQTSWADDAESMGALARIIQKATGGQ